MSKVKTECECKAGSETAGMQIDTKESDCCKVKIQEINNSNTLEKNNIIYKHVISVGNIVYINPPCKIVNSIILDKNLSKFNKPFTDIPVLYSSLLI